MKLDIKTFNKLVAAERYVGIDGYLIDDNKEQIPYHLYMFLVESQSLAAIIVKKMPIEENEYQIYEFNGNKLLDHNTVRIKELSSTTEKFKKYISLFENKQFQFQE